MSNETTTKQADQDPTLDDVKTDDSTPPPPQVRGRRLSTAVRAGVGTVSSGTGGSTWSCRTISNVE